MLIYKDGKVAHFKTFFPNTSFSDNGPNDDFLLENNCLKVMTFKPYNKRTEKLVSVEPYIEGEVVFTVAVELKSQYEIDQETEVESIRVRSQRDRLLLESDWVVIKSLETQIAVPQEWLDYRQGLRDVTLQEGFPYNVVWPVMPGTI